MPTPKEMLEVIDTYIPGNNEDIAIMVPCHVNTLTRIRKGDDNLRLQLFRNLEGLYKKALKMKKVMES